MADIVDKATRSRMMSGIRGKNTRPELFIRKALHKKGFRYKLHDKRLPGKPDLVFPRYRAVILVHGCFWHGHDCSLFKWPSTREEFWQAKIRRNREKDLEVLADLESSGWRVLVVWECAIKGRGKLVETELLDSLERWLDSDVHHGEIRGV